MFVCLSNRLAVVQLRAPSVNYIPLVGFFWGEVVVALYPAVDADANGVVLLQGEGQEVYSHPQRNYSEVKDFLLRRTSVDSVI